MIDFEAINRTALSALPAILRRILPDGKIVAREYVALNPTRGGLKASRSTFEPAIGPTSPRATRAAIP
jgi:hypothetical protein